MSSCSWSFKVDRVHIVIASKLDRLQRSRVDCPVVPCRKGKWQTPGPWPACMALWGVSVAAILTLTQTQASFMVS